MNSKLYRGRIVGMFGNPGSGIAVLAVIDDVKGKTLVPCEGNPTCRALDAAFPGTLIGGHTFDNDGIAGERIYYFVDQLGLLESFVPEGEATPEMVEEYEEYEATGANRKNETGAGDIIRPAPRQFH